MSTIGDRIKDLRIEAGMPQTELANRINVSKQTLYKYENNIITNIPSDKIEAIAAALNTSPAKIMGWDELLNQPINFTYTYHIDDYARNLAQFLYDHPEYKTMFDAVRKVKKDDIQFVKDFMERVTGDK